MYLLQTVDLAQAAGGQSPPFAVGIPVCAVMVVAAPAGFTASIADALTKQAIPLPQAGKGFSFNDPITAGLVVTAAPGSAGTLLIGLGLTPQGYTDTTPSGVPFKGSGSIVDNGLNAAGIVQLLNPAGSGVVAVVTKVDVDVNSAAGWGLSVGADIGNAVAPNGNNIGGLIQPMSGAAIAAGVVSKLVYRFRQDGATTVSGVGSPGSVVETILGAAGRHMGLRPDGQRWTLNPGFGLILRGSANDNSVATLNTEHTEQ